MNQQTRYKVDPISTGERWVGEEVRDAQPIQLRSGVAAIDLQPVNVSPVFEPVRDGTRDSVSAQDRAIGYVIRLTPFLALAIGLALLGFVAFMLVTSWFGVTTSAIERLFVFLLCLMGCFGVFAVTMNKTDYQHSRAGVERHRISTAADLRKHEIDALLALRREALRHTIDLIERND